jgi:hypothetical protein
VVAAAVTRAANVVYVNDEIKERLKEYIPEYAKYTMVASNKLGQRAVDRQNELLRNLLGMEELPETITLAMKYNQILKRIFLKSNFKFVTCSSYGRNKLTIWT